MVTQDEKNALYAEHEIYFTKHYKYNTGAELTLENGIYLDAEGVAVDEKEVLTLEFTQETYEEIMKRTRQLLQLRGVKSVDDIDEKDEQVKSLVNDYRRKFKKINDSQLRAFIEQVRNIHRPQNIVALFQVINFSIMRKSLFKIHKNKTIETKFDVEILPEYWEGARETVDEIDALVSDFVAENVSYDKNNPLEVMIAVTTSILNTNESIAKVIGELNKKIIAVISLNNLSEDEADDIGYFRSRLVKLLS